MGNFHYNLILIAWMIGTSVTLAQTNLKIIPPLDPDGTVKLDLSTYTNLHKEASDYDLLAVFVKNGTEEYVSDAMQGQYTREGDYLVFTPYFPFTSGMTYMIRTRNENVGNSYSYQPFQVGKKTMVEPAEVISIYPLADQLPENLLRFYIYFKTPMKKGQALKYIQLVDDKGNIDRHAFMEFKQELWSADGKRLTVLFDPGRIKRGVSTNLLRGPALLEGKKYELIISGDWEDVYGQALSTNSTKKIQVVSAYDQQIELNNWGINKPRRNSNDAITLHFDRIIDHALLQSMIEIVNEEETPIHGHWEIETEERSIKFIPKTGWKKGNYTIIIDSRLEDVAGNNLQNLLDHHKMTNKNNNQTHHYINFRM